MKINGRLCCLPGSGGVRNKIKIIVGTDFDILG